MYENETESIGYAECEHCSIRTEVYLTKHGLRCETCKNNQPEPIATYTPDVRDYVDTRGEEMAENIEAFKDELPEIGFDIELEDGSVYEMDKMESHALLMKHGENWKQFIPAFIERVAKHFDDQTEPTKFSMNADWGTSNHEKSQSAYETHAELAPVVVYPALRAAKMQLSLMAMNGPPTEDETSDDNSTPSVIGMGDSELNVYSKHGRITVDHSILEQEGTDMDDIDFFGENGGDEE